MCYQVKYNGKRKTTTDNKMFMDPISVKECMLALKLKNTEGYDRIPQRVLIDGADILDKAYAGLSNRIYAQKKYQPSG